MATQVAIGDLNEWLQAQPENTADTPYELTITGLTDLNYTNVKNALKSNNRKYVDLRTTELPEVTNLMEAFRGCTTLVYAPSISSVSTGINYAFYGCSSLKEAPFIPTSCRNYQSAFYGCTSMTKAPVVPDSYDYMTQMFYNCMSITHKPLFYNRENQYNSWNVTTKNWKGTLEQIERNRTMLETQAESEGFEIQVYDTDRSTLLYTVNWVHISILSTWLASKEENTVTTPYKVYILGLTTSNVSDIKTALFANPTKYVDLRNTTIPSETDCSGLFFDYNLYTGCSTLVYAPVLSSGIISLNATFMRCLNLKEAPEIPSSVIDMNFAFESCPITEAPVLPSGLLYAISCFQGCANLVSTNNLNISTLTNCMYMFGYCTKLTTVQNLPPNLESMIGMFYGCTSLKTLGSVTIPSSVTNMRSAFRESGLTKAPVLPEGVTDITEAFCDCYDLRNVPYIPSTVTDAQSCFMGCSTLEIIDEFQIALEILRDNTSYKDMFKDCTSLKEIGYTPHFSNDWKLVYLDFDATSVKGKIYSRNKTSVTIPQTTITKSTLKLPLITDELMFGSISVSDLEDIIEGTNQQQGMLDTNYSWYGKLVIPPTGNNFIMYASDPDKVRTNLKLGDNIKMYTTMSDLEQDLPNLPVGQFVGTEDGMLFNTVDEVTSGVYNSVTSNAVAQALSGLVKSYNVDYGNVSVSSGNYYGFPSILANKKIIGYNLRYWESANGVFTIQIYHPTNSTNQPYLIANNGFYVSNLRVTYYYID